MALPLFSNNINSIKNINPIYSDRFDVEFSEDYLSHNLIKIHEKYMYFNLNYDSNFEIIPLESILKIIESKSKFDIPIYLYDEYGNTVKIIYLQNVKFIKVKDLLNFDYSSKDWLHIKVRYKYEKIIMLKDNHSLLIFKRKEKLRRLNSI